MKLKETPENYRKIKKINKKIIILTIIYSVLIFVISFPVYFWITDTNLSIAIPNGYYDDYFGEDNPYLYFSFGMKNYGLLDINDLKLEVRLDVKYFNATSEEHKKINFFLKNQFFGKISALNDINSTFIGEKKYFDCDFLEKFWKDTGNLVGCTFLISFTFEYNQFFNSLPVQVSFSDLDLYKIEFECLIC